MHLFGKRKKTRKELTLSAQGEAFAAGHLLCQGCQAHLPLEHLDPLKMVQCPKCKTINFVPLRIGKFWLYEPLGGGGMGSVYRALNREMPGEIFAVKVLSREDRNRPAQIQALLNEARIAKIIGDHPCLVNCVASGYEDGEYYAALECVEGDRLDKRIDLLGHLPEKDVLQVALHVLAAEQHIYDCGFLYRDLKPENIIINKEGYGVLIDYGLCIPRQNALNPGDEFISGSPYYLPPERLLGLGENACSEIYSLGMVMYYALSGQTYYDAGEVEALAKRHVSKVRLSVASKMRSFRPELAEILGTMIQQDYRRRYQTFEAVATAISQMPKLPS